MKLPNYIALFLFFATLLMACNKEKFVKKTLFLEEFNDNSKGWFSNPDTNILYSSSECIKIENGQLKMHFERGLGIPNCGGGWIEMELSDSSLNRSEYLDKIGVKIILNQGFFQRLRMIDSVVGNTTYSHALKSSTVRIVAGRHVITFPYGDNLVDSIDLSKNLFNGSEFVFVSPSNQFDTQLFIDKQLVDQGGIIWYSPGGIENDFNITIKIGYGQELIPHEKNLFIESIEIFTWKGEFCIDDI